MAAVLLIDAIFKFIFVKENCCIVIQMSFKFVDKKSSLL